MTGRRPTGERGSATVWVLALAAVLATVGAAVVLVGAAVVARHRATTAADLAALAAAPVTVVCAGVKSILDTAATLERLESLSVPVLGYRTDALPGFYVRDAGLPVPWRVDSAAEVAAVMRARAALRLPQGMVVAQPVAAADEMDRDLHDRTLAEGLAEVGRRGVVGKDVTPFLLAWFHEHTGGASLAANVALVLANAELAAAIATASPTSA